MSLSRITKDIKVSHRTRKHGIAEALLCNCVDCVFALLCRSVLVSWFLFLCPHSSMIRASHSERMNSINSPACSSHLVTSNFCGPLLAACEHLFFWLSQDRPAAVLKSGYNQARISTFASHSFPAPFFLSVSGEERQRSRGRNSQKYHRRPRMVY